MVNSQNLQKSVGHPAKKKDSRTETTWHDEFNHFKILRMCSLLASSNQQLFIQIFFFLQVNLRSILTIIPVEKCVLWIWPILTTTEQRVCKICFTHIDGISSSPLLLFPCTFAWHGGVIPISLTLVSLSTCQRTGTFVPFSHHFLSSSLPTHATVCIIVILLFFLACEHPYAKLDTI